MSQQPTIDGSDKGKQWLETTAVCKDNGKDNVIRESIAVSVAVAVEPSIAFTIAVDLSISVEFIAIAVAI